MSKHDFTIGQIIRHSKFGEGKVIDFPHNGYYIRVEFKIPVRDVDPKNWYDFNPTNLKLINKANGRVK